MSVYVSEQYESSISLDAVAVFQIRATINPDAVTGEYHFSMRDGLDRALILRFSARHQRGIFTEIEWKSWPVFLGPMSKRHGVILALVDEDTGGRPPSRSVLRLARFIVSYESGQEPRI